MNSMKNTRIVLFNSLNNILNHQIKNPGFDEYIICKYMTENLFNEVYYNEYKNKFEDLIRDILEMFKTETYDVILTIIEFVCSLVYETNEHYYNHNHITIMNIMIHSKK